MPADRSLIAAVRAALAAHADPVKAPQMQRYMKSALPFHGVQKPTRIAIARTVLAAHPLDAADATDWHDTIRALWHEATHREERYLALALAAHRRYAAHRTLAALPLYEELIVTGAWWDLVDETATGLLGDLLRAEHAAVAPVMRTWSRDPDLWKRRAAIVAQVKSRRTTDRELLYDCIEPNRGDPDFFIRKGIGWGLRAYAWVEPDEVVRYCATHGLSPLSRREALRNVARGT